MKEELKKKNKNAFQWDTYRPLVDCIPACTGKGGCIPAFTGQGGVCPGGVCLGGCGRHPPPGTKGRPPVDRQTPVKKFYIVGIITAISIPKKSLNFCKKLEDIGLFCVATGMYPSFRLLVMSALGFKSRVDSLTCCMLE